MHAPGFRTCTQTLEPYLRRVSYRHWRGIIAPNLPKERLLIRLDENGGKVGSHAGFARCEILFAAIRRHARHFVAWFLTRARRTHTRSANFPSAERRAHRCSQQSQHRQQRKGVRQPRPDGSRVVLSHFFTLPRRFPAVNPHRDRRANLKSETRRQFEASLRSPKSQERDSGACA